MSSRKITKILITVSLALLGSYIYLTSTISAMGYDIEREDQKLSDLKEHQSDLVVSLSGNKTPEFLTEQSESLNLVEVDNLARFIDARSSSFGQVSR